MAAESLRSLVTTTASVIHRNPPEVSNQIAELDFSQLVIGDIVRLSAGDMIPDDIRVLSAKDLFINQSSLTGESMPVEKHTAKNILSTLNIPDLPNSCFMDTNVVSGSALAIVVATGGQTFFGSIASTIVEEREPTSFDQGAQKLKCLLRPLRWDWHPRYCSCW